MRGEGGERVRAPGVEVARGREEVAGLGRVQHIRRSDHGFGSIQGMAERDGPHEVVPLRRGVKHGLTIWFELPFSAPT